MFAVVKRFFGRIKDFIKRILIKFSSDSTEDTPDNTKEDSDDENQYPTDIVCYYGCPNSKRIKALNTRSEVIKN